MGIGCRRDPLEANVWYVRAADAGYENARQRLEVIRAAAAGGGGDVRGAAAAAAAVPSLGGREGPAKMTKAPAKAKDLKGEKEKDPKADKADKGEKGEKKKFMGIF
jgi:TPR repeat protein